MLILPPNEKWVRTLGALTHFLNLYGKQALL